MKSSIVSKFLVIGGLSVSIISGGVYAFQDGSLLGRADGKMSSPDKSVAVDFRSNFISQPKAKTKQTPTVEEKQADLALIRDFEVEVVPEQVEVPEEVIAAYNQQLCEENYVESRSEPGMYSYRNAQITKIFHNSETSVARRAGLGGVTLHPLGCDFVLSWTYAPGQENDDRVLSYLEQAAFSDRRVSGEFVRSRVADDIHSGFIRSASVSFKPILRD